MSDPGALDVPFLEYLGVSAIQRVVDASLGPGVLTVAAGGAGLSLKLDVGHGQAIDFSGISFDGGALNAHLSIDGISDDNPLQATLLDGFSIALTAFEVAIVKGDLRDAHVQGRFQIPFFTDDSGQPKSVDVELTVRADGGLSITLAATTQAATTADGLVQLEYAIGGGAVVVELNVASFEVDQLPDGTWRILISGRLQLTTADLQWPGFELKGLGIDSHGNISIDGGWIDLPSQTALDFYGFHVGLQRLGFGHDSSGRWLGFNGDIHLVEGLSLGGSVRGLRINLDSGALSFDGVAIEFSVPGVLSISGEIDHVHVDAQSPDDLRQAGLLPGLFDQIQNAPGEPPLPKKVDVFAGDVDVDVEVLPGLSVQGRFIVGHFGGTSVFFLALDAELPVGIPIFIDVSLYGINGLFASNLQPQPEPDHTWWEWYKYPTDATGIDVNAPPDYDATAVAKWLSPQQGALALGAGATIGTSDDGFTASAAISLVLMMPGPVIALVGKANILSKRIGAANQDANFEALAVYDGRSGTFDLTIDAHYSIPVVLEIDGTAQVHVGKPPEHPSWFLALGKPPHEKRLKARILSLFETDAYLVVSDQGLVTGTWTGYRGSWSFGPLSVSLESWLATIAAIQWSPLQIAGGVELRGDVHLEAFGIGLGISAEALLEATATRPFWVHGELGVELDLPWPLPDVGATVSLTWGGDDGTFPPSPMPLGQINANLRDHIDAAGKPASDQYLLLAHRPGFPVPEPSLRYDDPAAPGILAPDAASEAVWQSRVAGRNPGDAKQLLTILPALAPGADVSDVYAPVVPQDTHFTLTFSHPVDNATNFVAGGDAPVEIVKVDIPPIVGADDMSDLSFFQPAVQWQHSYSLAQVALYEYDGAAWQPVCSMPDDTAGPGSPQRLAGVWLAPPAGGSDARKQTRLRVIPCCLLPGDVRTAAWGEMPAGTVPGSDFIDQGVELVLDDGLDPARIDSVSAPGTLRGLLIHRPAGSKTGAVKIRFPLSVNLLSIQSLVFTKTGDPIAAPLWLRDGAPLAIATQNQDAATSQWTQSVAESEPAVQELSTTLDSGALLIYGLTWRLPAVTMAILPKAPALYAVQTVTRVFAGRVKDGGAVMQPVAIDPIVETGYLQTAAGPGAACIDNGVPAAAPYPHLLPPFPLLSRNCLAATVPPNATPTGQQPTAAFPLGGAQGDLASYVQWFWPPNGALAAYYGYDFNVEFVETYVNALYAGFSGGSPANALHLRCFDRNRRRSLIQNADIHVDSIPQMSALVAQPASVPLPDVLKPAPSDATRWGTLLGNSPLSQSLVGALQQRAKLASSTPQTPAYIASEPSTLSASEAQLIGRLNTRVGPALVEQIPPALAGSVLGVIGQQDDARVATSLWFKPISPRTQYTLDVLAGPLWAKDAGATAPDASLDAVFNAASAGALLRALRAWLDDDDKRLPLARAQFTTSRYATFAAHVANIAEQIKNTAGVAPLRYYAAKIEPVAWLADPTHHDSARVDALHAYMDARTKLATIVASFDPLADPLRSDGTPAANGAVALAAARAYTQANWAAFSAATNTMFDALVTALGHAEFAGTAQAPNVPDTELSLFRASSGTSVLALLLESPEPLPWQRIWRWIEVGNGMDPVLATHFIKPTIAVRAPVSDIAKPVALALPAPVDAPAPVAPPSGDDVPSFGSTPPTPKEYNIVLWNGDGTRGLIVLGGSTQSSSPLNIAFQGNIGAEAPCITRSGKAVVDQVDLGTLQIGPRIA